MEARLRSGYTLQLSSHLESDSALNPMEVAFAEVGLYGSISLYRFVSGERVACFDLTASEVDALVAANRRRRALIRRNTVAIDPNELPF